MVYFRRGYAGPIAIASHRLSGIAVPLKHSLIFSRQTLPLKLEFIIQVILLVASVWIKNQKIE